MASSADADSAASGLPSAAFGAPFWFSYAANTLMMTAVSLLFVYADFIRLIGDPQTYELQLGLIVGTGMVGSILMRFVQGVGIDRIGARHVWLWSTGGYVVCCLLHLVVERVNVGVYVLRIAYQSCLAGFFGASIAYVSGRAPIARLAEVVGTLGTSGFVGIMLGTAIGRAIVGEDAPTRAHIDSLFMTSAALASVALACAAVATSGQVRKRSKRRPPHPIWLLRRYNPGLILIMSVATGMGLGLPQTFLRPYLLEAGSKDLAENGMIAFFELYPPIAFITRITMRRVPDRFGIRPMIALGLASLVIGMLLFLCVSSPLTLIPPAIFIGVAHASLFPAVVAGASGAFPGRYRGLGTTLVLAMFDVGTFLGAPLAGEIVTRAEQRGWPPYSVMFGTMAVLLASSGVVYFGYSKKVPERRGMEVPEN
jgi:MFS family permease